MYIYTTVAKNGHLPIKLTFKTSSLLLNLEARIKLPRKLEPIFLNMIIYSCQIIGQRYG